MKGKLSEAQRKVLEAMAVEGANLLVFRILSKTGPGYGAAIRNDNDYHVWQRVNYSTYTALESKGYVQVAEGKQRDWRKNEYRITEAGRQALSESREGASGKGE